MRGIFCEKDGGDRSTEVVILAVLGYWEYRIFRPRRLRKMYLVLLPWELFAAWRDEEDFVITDDSIPMWWISDTHTKNVTVYSTCPSVTAAYLRYSTYAGPSIFMEADKQNLLAISDGERDLTEVLRQMYLLREGVDISRAAHVGAEEQP